MKRIIIILVLFFNLTLYAQSNQMIGVYTRTLGQEETHIIVYKLILHQDGTFLFHSYSNNKLGIPPEVHRYGKGTWSVKNNVVTFFSNKENDFDKKYTLDFGNSKARFVTKHPRDKTDRIIQTKLQFFDSEIPWIKRIDIFRI